MKTHQSVIDPWAYEHVVVIPIEYNNLHGWDDWNDGSNQIIKQTNKIYIVPIRAILGQAQLVQYNAALDRIDTFWPVNIYVDIDTYWTV